MIEMRVDEVSLKNIENQLGFLYRRAPNIMKKALNETAKSAQKKLSDKAQQTYAISNVSFRKVLSIKSATNGNLVATLQSSGRSNDLIRFKTTPTGKTKNKKGDSAVKAKVLKANSLKSLQTGDLKAFITSFKSGHTAVVRRVNSKGRRIKALYSVSVPQMLGNEARVYDFVKPSIQEELKANVAKYIKMEIGGVSHDRFRISECFER